MSIWVALGIDFCIVALALMLLVINREARGAQHEALVPSIGSFVETRLVSSLQGGRLAAPFPNGPTLFLGLSPDCNACIAITRTLRGLQAGSTRRAIVLTFPTGTEAQILRLCDEQQLLGYPVITDRNLLRESGIRGAPCVVLVGMGGHVVATAVTATEKQLAAVLILLNDHIARQTEDNGHANT